MSTGSRMNPVKFISEWALTVPIRVPKKGQVSYASTALQFHASLLYTNPLSKDLSARDRDRFVRQQLALYRTHLTSHGFIETTVLYKGASHSFLRGFSSLNGQLFYKMSDEVAATPMKYCALKLQNHALGKADMDVIRFIYRWLTYLRKFPLARPDLLGPAKLAWIERQVSPAEITVPYGTLEDVRRIVSWLVEPKFGYVGNHGPGKTSNGAKTVPEKNRDYRPTLQIMQITAYLVDNVFFEASRIRDAEWTAVFKDVGSLRPITMEPVEMQHAQQGMKYDLYQQIDDPRYGNAASNFIRFSDQSLSQEAAIRGSRLVNDWRKPSTIDLSAASDHLSVDLIVALFSGNLLHDLLCGRSWNVRVGKRSVQLSMFGGMGSALTFPIQSLVFLAFTIFATLSELYLREYGVEGSIDDLFECYILDSVFVNTAAKIMRSIRLYGDDIACPDMAAPRLMRLLEACGLKVNRLKSFIGDSPVRESCGVYALAGYDITPKCLHVPDSGQVTDGAQYESLRATANEAFLDGDLYLYRAIIKHVMERDMFMSSRERKRRYQKSERLYPHDKWVLGKPQLLFEEYYEQTSPEDVRVGFLSTRGTIPTQYIQTHETFPAFTTFYVGSDTERDDESEYYHLTVNYRGMAADRPSIEKHGSLPAGIRLKPRIATRSIPNRTSSTMDWGWAPS